MSTTIDYATRIQQAQETISNVSEARIRDAKALFHLVPTPGNGFLSPSDVIDQNLRIAKNLVQVNVDYARELAVAIRNHVTGLAAVLADEVATTAKLANAQAEKAEEVAVDQAQEIVRAERTAARRAKKAAVDAAAERYQGMTKVELSEELAGRALPKTGNVDELRERLIESDLQDA
jgi:7-cyano-7-deazaguanine synthase in queuosine biosynthesis